MATKLSEMVVPPQVNMEMTKACVERLTNINVSVNNGVKVSQGILFELVITEIKFDALMLMLESQGMDFSKYPDFMLNAAKQNQATAINIRETMMKEAKDGNPS